MHQKRKFKVTAHRNARISFKTPIITLYLPRPGIIPEKLKKFFPKGGVYPLHFERKLKKFVGTKDYLHIFAGSSSTGLRLDLRFEVRPDIVADAHHLPFRDGVFEAVVMDPPYNDNFAHSMFKTPKLKERTWLTEASRVCKPGGKVAVYHNFIIQPIKILKIDLLVVTLLRFRQYPRILTVFTKDGMKAKKITDF